MNINMKEQKNYIVSLFIIGCILINYAGKVLAATLELPLWLDSVGTALTAYVYGPVCGAIVGATANITYSFFHPNSYIYALTNMAIGIIIGICTKRGMLKDLFGILSTSFLVTIASVMISTPLNYLYAAGKTGNKWGDGIIDLLQEWGCNAGISYMVGEFYMDFLDKVLITLFLFAVLQIYHISFHHRKKNTKKRLGILFTGILLSSFAIPKPAAYAVTKKDSIDFNSYVQTIYNGDNGLPGGMATDIEQTKDGILWIGTYGGLYRYNGSEFQWMNNFESIKNVSCFYTDEEGRLWIGTNDNGLSICINDSISNVINEENGLPANSVRCIAGGTDGSYYVGTTDSLAIVTLSSGLSVSETIPEISYANSLSVYKGNAAVVTNEGNLYLVHESYIMAQDSFNRRGETFTCCTFNKSGDLYVGTTSNEIQIYNTASGTLQREGYIPCEGLANIQSLRFSEEGRLFICADNGAGYVDTFGTYHTINTNKFSSSINHMLIDYQGNLWFTSSRLGLLKLCKSVFTEVYSKTGLEETVVNTITKWQGKMYFGTDTGLDITNGKMTTALTDNLSQKLEGIRIRCLMTDSKKNLWICTSGMGVWQVKKNGNITIYNTDNGALGDHFHTVIELHDGTVVAAGDTGVTYIEHGQVTHTIGSAEGLRNPKISCLLETDDGRLLAGTDGDGIIAIKNKKTVRSFQKKDGLSSEVILHMVTALDNQGIFIVTSNGLCFMNKNDQIHFLDNFPYYNNFDIIEGINGMIFVLGSSGIYVTEKDTLLSGGSCEYLLLDSKKGLRQSLTPDAWNYLDHQNRLFLAGDTGVTMIHLDNYDTTPRSYRMQLKSIQVDGTKYSVERGETITIPREAERIEVTPEIVNYSTNNPYVSICMEGFDSQPKILLQNELSNLVYTNLPAGSYTFRLAVLDRNNTVIAESTYQIVKEQEIYSYWWFRFYLIFVFILVIIYLAWMLFRTQVQKTLNIQKRELEMTKRQVEMSNEAIITIAKTVDARDKNTSQHSLRVSEYSVMIAQHIGYDEETCEELRKTALLHDIGKIGIPDSILNKPARLTDEEYAIMKSHVEKGAEILKNFTSVENIVEGALYHHERYDGNGYLQHLKGEEIPLNARIIGIADAFDAMTANRVYRKKLDLDYVIAELKRGRGTQFDPNLVDVFLELLDNGTIQVEKLYEEDTENHSERKQ